MKITPLFKKLNLKYDNDILIINAPDSFETEISSLEKVQICRTAKDADKITFLLAFVTQIEEVAVIASLLSEKSSGDVIAWCAYPKKSSKRYDSEVHRGSDWSSFGQLGFEAVRQVAIDDDWSALRFRRVEFINTMKRSPKRALSAVGKKKTIKHST